MSDEHREYAREKHMMLARYCVMKAWFNKIDCGVIQRDEMEQLIGIKKFTRQRVAWIKEDFSPWFPYIEIHVRVGMYNRYSVGYFSRVMLKQAEGLGPYSSTVERIIELRKKSLNIGYFFNHGVDEIPDLEGIKSDLLLMEAGIKLPGFEEWPYD